MKVIGILGGANSSSTIDCYTTLIKIAAKRGLTPPRILIWSMDYQAIKSEYQKNWKGAVKKFHSELTAFLNTKPGSLLIANHTLHKAFDELNKKLSIPIFHSANLTTQEIKKRQFKSVLVLGTKFFMSTGYFEKVLIDAGIQSAYPREEDWVLIQRAQEAVVKNKITDQLKVEVKELLATYSNFDAVVLACTELPSIVDADICSLPILNPLQLQCEAAVSFYFG